VTFVGLAWIGRQNGAPHAGVELADGLIAGATHYSLFDRRGRLGVEVGDRVGEFACVQVADLAALQHRQRPRQPVDECPRHLQAGGGRARREPQGRADLFLRVVDRFGAGPIKGVPVQGGEYVLLRRLQPGDLTLEADEQVDAGGAVQPGRIDRGQRPDYVGARRYGCGPGCDVGRRRVGLNNRHASEHVSYSSCYDSARLVSDRLVAQA